MDVLIQRYLPAAANEAHHANGAWEDVDTIPVDDSGTAAETREAARVAVRERLATLEPLRGDAGDRIRVVDFARVREFNSSRAAPDLNEDTPALRGDGA